MICLYICIQLQKIRDMSLDVYPTMITPIIFIDEDDNRHEGLFIPKEEIFYIGFDDVGEFKFKFQAFSWIEMTDEYVKEKNITW